MRTADDEWLWHICHAIVMVLWQICHTAVGGADGAFA